MLQTVSLFSGLLDFDHRVLGLINLSTLQTLELGHIGLLDDLTACHLADLLLNMTTRRPDVACRVPVIRCSPGFSKVI